MHLTYRASQCGANSSSDSLAKTITTARQARVKTHILVTFLFSQARRESLPSAPRLVSGLCRRSMLVLGWFGRSPCSGQLEFSLSGGNSRQLARTAPVSVVTAFKSGIIISTTSLSGTAWRRVQVRGVLEMHYQLIAFFSGEVIMRVATFKWIQNQFKLFSIFKLKVFKMLF